MAGLQRDAGDIVGGYRVLARLGSGGSGSVYRVADEAGHEAALKLVDAREDEVAAARLAREVRALQSLRHPAVPQVLDAELDEDQTFVVFELVDGETLFDHVRRHGPLAGTALADFADRTASALEAVHAAGVVHRDVTPSNVMMGAAGPVLIDFGLAHRTDDSRLTREGLVSGTPGYVAPEVIDGAEPGMAADRWSWAATVAFAMTGQGPFGSGTGAISRTLEAAVALPDVPGAAALAAALARDPASRPGMRDVVAALRGATVVLPAAFEAGPAEEALPATMVAPTALPATAVMAGRDRDATTVLPSGDQEVQSGPGAEGDAWIDGFAWDDAEDGDGAPKEPEDTDEDSAADAPAPPPRRRGLLLLVALVVVVAAPLAPTLAFLVMAALAVVARGVYRRAAALEAVAARRGRRRTADTVVQTLGLPWHIVRAAAESVPALLTAAALGIGAGAGAWWLVSAEKVVGGSPDAQYYGHAGAIALGALVAVIALAFGPFMRGTREGAHRLAAALSPTGGLRAAWAIVALTAVLVASIGIYVQLTPWWWPLPDLPIG